MARKRRRRSLVPQAEQALDRYKYEIASELGLTNQIQTGGWNNLTTRQVGQIGGQMVKRMIQDAEQQLQGKQY
ncbi:alpha/beta-type small acid-soluble spore protein [Anaerobranca gottschalkii]|uniref:Small, acid-soluble spore protein, alpha/beta type n=1 Tax=Anaerobranca gottschalkii DSM 13577 TaxID=1120990 RepID=A0A1H9YYE1_9FIRM|nr:alpha/beta-type small acid-soluble spore protein [Anaerobranca gottschalkii]SES74223.1 Small, acid-soluble spore protein, alpha/beta type [Anaerobranca gottschalkii DSM 13577]